MTQIVACQTCVKLLAFRVSEDLAQETATGHVREKAGHSVLYGPATTEVKSRIEVDLVSSLLRVAPVASALGSYAEVS